MTKQTNPCGCGSLPRTLITGRSAERPSPESSPLVAVSGGRAEAQRSRPERPALTKSAGGPARDCGPPGAGASREPRPTGCCAGVRSTAGVGSRARSSPLPSGPPSVRPLVRQHGPAPAKASAPSPPTCSKMAVARAPRASQGQARWSCVPLDRGEGGSVLRLHGAMVRGPGPRQPKSGSAAHGR